MPTRVDSRQLRRYVVRIVHSDGVRTLGTGFFVAPRWVVTCAHVVYDEVEGNELQTVLVVSDPSLGSVSIHAEVAARSEPPQMSQLWPFPDMALLRLTVDQDYPPVRLRGDDPAGAECYSWGYSILEEGVTPLGSPASFSFEGVEGSGYLKLKAGQAEPGLSGSPLVCPIRRAVVGIIVASRNIGSDLGGWASPMSALLRGAPGVPVDLATLGSEIAWENEGALLSEPLGWDSRVFVDLAEEKSDAAPREVTTFRCHRLGERFGYFCIFENGGTSQELEAESQWAAVEHICDQLGVPHPPKSPPKSQSGPDGLLLRIYQGNQVAAQLKDIFGNEASAAFKFGFNGWVFTQFALTLSASQRSDTVADLRMLIQEAGMPVSVLGDAAGKLESSTNGQELSGAVLAMSDRACALLENGLGASSWRNRSFGQVWSFAWSAALAASSAAYGMSRGLVDAEVQDAQTFAQDLGLELPTLFIPTGNHVADQAAALHYLLKEICDTRITSRLEDCYGEDALRVLRVCTRMFAWILWPDPGFAHDLSLLVEEELGAIKLPRRLWSELVAELRNDETPDIDYEETKQRVFEFDAAVRRYWGAAGQDLV